MMKVESSYNTNAKSKTDTGIMQINKVNQPRLKELLYINDFTDPYQNIKAGVFIMAEIKESYSDMNEMLMVYNCGEHNAKKLFKRGITSTDYSRKVLSEITKLKPPADSTTDSQ